MRLYYYVERNRAVYTPKILCTQSSPSTAGAKAFPTIYNTHTHTHTHYCCYCCCTDVRRVYTYIYIYKRVCLCACKTIYPLSENFRTPGRNARVLIILLYYLFGRPEQFSTEPAHSTAQTRIT
jgi:hypothetical protein